MDEQTKYTPIGERINQDVIHDNFVPKYSALATAPRTKLVLVGVWLIFAPWSLSVFAFPAWVITGAFGTTGGVTDFFGSLVASLFGLLAFLIVFTQTKRYLSRDVED